MWFIKTLILKQAIDEEELVWRFTLNKGLINKLVTAYSKDLTVE